VQAQAQQATSSRLAQTVKALEDQHQAHQMIEQASSVVRDQAVAINKFVSLISEELNTLSHAIKTDLKKSTTDLQGTLATAFELVEQQAAVRTLLVGTVIGNVLPGGQLMGLGGAVGSAVATVLDAAANSLNGKMPEHLREQKKTKETAKDAVEENALSTILGDGLDIVTKLGGGTDIGRFLFLLGYSFSLLMLVFVSL
jgi:outer membrane lipoprotein SlyB